MTILKVNNLHVNAGNKEILKGIDFTINEGETVALLGPNGNGKSTLLGALMGDPSYVITSGNIEFNGKDITNIPADERSKLGMFLGMQNPAEVPGVNNSDFLKAAMNSHSDSPIPLFKFYRELENGYKRTDIPFEFSLRNLNEGFSGGEKKKNEILQMLLLKPKFVMLDEIDSGLDVDAIQTVSRIISEEEEKGRAFLIVSHYARLYQKIKVNRTLIMVNGKIAFEGDESLIKRVDKEGYNWLKTEYGISLENDEENMNEISIGVCATKELINGK